MAVKFLGAFLIVSTVVGGASLLWPKFTKSPRPRQLETVREVVLKTPIGQQAATVFGVTDESNVEPVNVSSLAGSLANEVMGAVSSRINQEVTDRAVNQIISQIDKLPEEQRQTLEHAMCNK